MCFVCQTKVHAQDLQGRAPSVSARPGREGKAVPRSVCGSPRFSFALTLVIGVTLACIAGSEYDQGNRRRGLGDQHGAAGLLHSFNRYLAGLHRAADSKSPLLTRDQVDDYIRDGFVVISGLLDDDEMGSLVGAGESLVSKHIEKSGGKGPAKGNFQVHEFGLLLNDKRFRDVALHSRLPRAAAELMQLDDQTQHLRILKDVFLAKGHESTSSCGWHVDDQLFWPAAYKMPTTSEVDQSGINAWVAMDDMPIEYGGSMAVSPQSHSQDFTWKEGAFDALNFKDDFGNGVSKDDLFDMIKSGKVDSCGLQKVAPEVYDEIEMSKQEFNIKRGDVVFMNRWLFHKSTDFTEKGKLALQALQDSLEDDRSGSALLKRYSLRFVTGSTSLPGGFMTELSVLADGVNLGKELNEVQGEWYPKCWPEVDGDVHERIDHLNENDVPRAQEKLGAIMTEVMQLFAKR